MKDLDLSKTMQENQEEYENVCIIADKVFASCQQRKCFSKIEVDLDGKTFKNIKFKPGFIVPNTLTIMDIANQPNFKRVRFTLRIPFEVITTKGNIIKGFLPDIYKDVILFMPDARDEFEFRIVVETSSEILGEPIETDNKLTFAVGVFIITKVVGTVQLLIPTYGYCPAPDPCVEFSPEDLCDEFDDKPFPDFFPPQFEDI